MNAPTNAKRGRQPVAEQRSQREKEISALERELLDRKARLDALREAEAKARRAERRAYLQRRRQEVGELVRIAGLIDEDLPTLLGALLALAESRNSNGAWPEARQAEYRKNGEERLATLQAERRRRGARTALEPDDDLFIE